jgi:flagellar hook-associated protein 1
MGFSPLMNIGVRAMTANYAQLQATSHNIANANVAGYSRQQAELSTAAGRYTNQGFFGRGVDVATVSRSHNEFLTREASTTQALASMDASRLTQLTGLETLFKPGEEGLGHATNELFNALSDLSSHPDDRSTRQVVLARAGDLASRFNEAGTRLDSAQTTLSTEFKTAVASINDLAKSIANANQRISSLRGLGQPANDLLDERERLMSKLSEQIKITRVDATDGSTAVFIAGGQRLVLGNDVAELKVVQDRQDPSRAAIGIVDGPFVRTLESDSFGGGNLAGLLQFQNHDLATGRALIGRLAAAVGGALNEQQHRGITLQPPLGTHFGQDMFVVGEPQALANAENARSGGAPIASVKLKVIDASALQPSDYDLRESASTPGAWALTRLSDGVVRTVNSGDVVDGVQIDVLNPQSGDSFLLQPVSRAANGMRALLENPLDVAAAAPLLANTAVTNTGSVVIAGLSITKSPLPVPGGSTQIQFTDNLGNFSWTLKNASGAVVGSGTGAWDPGKTVPTPPQDINGFALNLSGIAKLGDVINVVSTPASAVSTNNGNAIAMQALRDAGVATGSTASDAWSQALAEVGVRVQSAKSVASISEASAQQAEQSRSSQAGVNLDEEAARLIQYQQSYQAAAKVLQVAQTVFDTLIQTAAR